MYIVKFVCDDMAEVLINGKYHAKNRGPRVSTISIPEKPHSIVAKCTDTGGGCGFRLVCIDAKTGEVVCKTGLNDGWTSDTGKIAKATNQTWGRSEIGNGAIAIWSYPNPDIRHRGTKTCTLYWKSNQQYDVKYIIIGAIALLAISVMKKKSK